MTRRRWVRRVLVTVAGLVAGMAVLLAVEVQIARSGPRLPDRRLELDLSGSEPGLVRWWRIVWLGDSTAAGVGASEAAQALPRLVANQVGVPVTLRVLAVSGATVADVVTEQAPQVAALEPDVVVVSVGSNDVTRLTREGAFRHRYQQLVAALPEETRLVLLGVPDMGSIPRLAQPLRAVAGWRGQRLDAVVAGVADTAGAIYVDIAGATGPAFRDDPGRYFAADRYHPSDAGYQLWAEAVLAAVHRWD